MIPNLIPNPFRRRPEPTPADDVAFLARQPCYDLGDRETREHLEEVRVLLGQRRIRVERDTRHPCGILTSVIDPRRITDHGRANIAYADSVAVSCRNPAHLYTEEFHGGLTQAVVRIRRCLKHGPNFRYYQAWGDTRQRVIGSSPRVFSSVTEALRR